MRSYSCLSTSKIEFEKFHIEPLRDEDKYEIMEIRNQQIYHLRQNELLTKGKQDQYFSNVVSGLFEQEKPNQLLFSFFEDGSFIGYGGLVHINWIDKNAEISFVMKTELETDFFSKYWSNYLKLIEILAFDKLNFHKIYTYAFDLRPHLYPILERQGFKEEARLKDHCFFEGEFLDVVFHSKMNNKISYRSANHDDLMLYFQWTNDPTVRENSYNQEYISLQNHEIWFLQKLNESNCFMLVFSNHLNKTIGQVRIQINDDKNATIGISTDAKYRGKGYSVLMIIQASEYFLKKFPNICISAYVKIDNKVSAKTFEKSGYFLDSTIQYENIPSYHFIKRL